MSAALCRWESDLVDAVASGRWPSRVDAELRAHVAGCATCADTAAVVKALLDGEVSDPSRVVSPPPAPIVWWRAQLRAREEAARAAARPMWVAFVAALACSALAAAALLLFAAPSLGEAARAFATTSADLIPSFDRAGLTGAAATALASRGVQLAAAAWLVLAPVAVYFAVVRD